VQRGAKTSEAEVWAGIMLGYLQYYRSLGFALIPVGPKSKIPIIKWKRYYAQGYYDNDYWELVEKYWAKDESIGVAVLCGSPSNNLVGIDFDSEAIYQRVFNPIQLQGRTLIVRTPRGGYHVYFRSDKTVPTYKFMNVRIEVHGDGSILILPPSIHPIGARYELVSRPIEIPTIRDFVTEFGKTLREKLGINPAVASPTIGDCLRRWEGKRYRGRHPNCIHKLMKGVDEGFRNEATCRLYTYFVRVRDWNRAKAISWLFKWNQSNRPPLLESELLEIIRSMEKGGYQYGCRSLAEFCDPEGCPFYKKLAEVWEFWDYG